MSFGYPETPLNSAEDAVHMECIHRYDVQRVKQQVEDVLFGCSDGHNRMSPLQALIYGTRLGHDDPLCKLGRYALLQNTSAPTRLQDANASSILEDPASSLELSTLS